VLEVVFFLVLGILFGVIMGMLPGIHPNMIVLLVPLLTVANIDTLPLLSFIVALGVTNSVIDFVPSILFGAPDIENSLSVLPGHRMLLDGDGYNAIKLAIVGSLGAMIFLMAILPILALVIPIIYNGVSPFIIFILIAMVAFMILTENGIKKLFSVMVFFLAGVIGITMNSFPISSTLVLFPIFSGFFGVSVLILQMRSGSKIPKQKNQNLIISRKVLNRSIFFGTLAGIASGFLPGVGASEIAGIASSNKNHKSFLVTIGSLTTANTILAILCLWLIGKSRSGLAVVIEQLTIIGLGEVVFIAAVAMASIGIAVAFALILAKKSTAFMERINYSTVSKIIIALIVFLTAVFTGPIGIFILLVCTALGIFTNMINVKRGNLMGVLILPTILFYLGI
jgi:putative membrane protein